MALYVYQGMTEKQKKAMFEARRKGICPQDKRGEDPYYFIRSVDSEALKEEKRKRVAEYVKQREKELKDDIEVLAAKMTIAGVEFPAGKPVAVDDASPLIKKLGAMCGKDGSMKLVEPEKKEKPTKE